MKDLVIGISGINAVDNPGPGVGVARSLKKDKGLNAKIVGLVYDAMEPGVYMDWLIDKSFMMPYPSGKFEMIIDRLLYIKKRSGLDFIIPNLDVELPVYIKYADELARNGIKTFLPSDANFRLRGKDKIPDVAANISIKVPKTEIVTSYDDLLSAIDKIGFPLMVKGAYYKAHKAYTTQEAISHYHEIVAEWGYPIIVQQVVSGEEMNVVGVGDGEGGSLGNVGVKKLWVTSQGKIWTGVSVKNEKMMAATEAFIKKYKWKGPFEMECIVNGDDVYLIEINPRFLAWSFFAAELGINLPANMVRRAFNMKADETSIFEAGKLFIRYTYELVTNMDAFQNIVTAGEH